MDAAKGADEFTAIGALEARRRRLRFRAWHRGMREMDLILGPFADAFAPGWDDHGLERFEALLEEADPDLLNWVIGQERPPAAIDAELLARLIAFHQSAAAQQQ